VKGNTLNPYYPRGPNDHIAQEEKKWRKGKKKRDPLAERGLLAHLGIEERARVKKEEKPLHLLW